MKAWRIERHGGPEVLKYIDIPTPEPGPMEVRVRVQACGLNHLDLWVRNGVPGHKFPLPITPGGDVAGVIDKFGPGADAALLPSAMKEGSTVILNPGVSCGHCEACLGGFDPLCRDYAILGERRDGGCAEFIVAPVANIIERPKNLSVTEAASLSVPYLTAWTMLVRKADIKAGETILIQAGGSGVSVAAIQMAKLFNATVITTVGSDEKASKAKALGAEHVINYRKGPFRAEVKTLLSAKGKKGCDIVIDHVGADTFEESIRCLNWGGRLVTCGATSGAEIKLDLRQVFFKNISIFGSTMGSKADFIHVVSLVGEGKIKAVMDSTYSIEKLPEAMNRLESRAAFGKVVLCFS